MSNSRELVQQLLALEPRAIHQFVTNNINSFGDKNFWKDIITEMQNQQKDSIDPLLPIKQCVAVCLAAKINYTVVDEQYEYDGWGKLDFEKKAEISTDLSNLQRYLENAYPKESHPQSETKTPLSFMLPASKLASDDKEYTTPLAKQLLNAVFDPALHIRKAKTNIFSNKQGILLELKQLTENLSSAKDVEKLAHKIEIKIAEWEKKKGKSHEHFIQQKKIIGAEEKKQALAAYLPTNSKEDHTYIKYLAKANQLIAETHILLLERDLKKLSQEDKLSFINSKIEDYKEEIKEFLIAKGVNISEEKTSTSTLSKLFNRGGKPDWQAMSTEYFTRSPYGRYLSEKANALKLTTPSSSP